MSAIRSGRPTQGWAPWPSIDDGSVQALKWVSCVSMTGDHINKYVFHEAYPALFSAGRLAMPLFAMILGVNLARPHAASSGAIDRTVGRLLVFGTLATVPFYLLHGYVVAGLPLNVLFTLAVAALVIQSLSNPGRHRRWVAAGVFVLGGALVEFWWPAVALVLGAWGLASGRRPMLAATAALLGLVGLCVINGNAWALASMALWMTAAALPFRVPRWRAFFYVYYPLHLALIYAYVRATS